MAQEREVRITLADLKPASPTTISDDEAEGNLFPKCQVPTAMTPFGRFRAAMAGIGSCIARVPKICWAATSLGLIGLVIIMIIWIFTNFGQPERPTSAASYELEDLEGGKANSGTTTEAASNDILEILGGLPFFQ